MHAPVLDRQQLTEFRRMSLTVVNTSGSDESGNLRGILRTGAGERRTPWLVIAPNGLSVSWTLANQTFDVPAGAVIVVEFDVQAFTVGSFTAGAVEFDNEAFVLKTPAVVTESELVPQYHPPPRDLSSAYGDGMWLWCNC